MQNHGVHSSWLPWKHKIMSHTHRSPKRYILHSASYTKTQLPPEMVARLPKMVAFSADYPPDGAISSVKCCWAEESYTLLVFWGVFLQVVCAHAQIGGRPLSIIMQNGKGCGQPGSLKIVWFLTAVLCCSRRQSNRATVKQKCMSTTFLQPNSRHHIKSERGLWDGQQAMHVELEQGEILSSQNFIPADLAVRQTLIHIS